MAFDKQTMSQNHAEEEMTLREQVFRKMGYKDGDWKEDDGSGHGRNDKCYGLISPDEDEEFEFNELPEIASQWEVTAKFLVPFMREKGINWFISGRMHYPDKTPLINEVFHWQVPLINEVQLKAGYDVDWIESEIKDDNIALAACEAFMEVEL